ncbi:MAG: hypothetical protein CME64_06860 [Halobacteriovoraceae bacterium]|nr:hypothetical protein [Halobacteriovoraceae bacterium]|tara:strand:- start:8505 stop:9428 length:924 start_codon:yes stop_codon:yes gene_type:complete
MKKLFAFLIICSGLSYAHVDLEKLNKNHCDHTINKEGTIVTPPLFFEKSALQRKNNQYEFRLNSEAHILKGTTGTIKDFIIAHNHLWTVGNAGLRQFDLEGNLVKVFAHTSWQQSRHNLPRSVYFNKRNDTLYMASGKVGLVAFNLTDQRFMDTNSLNVVNENGHLSAAVAVVGDGEDTLYIAMTGNSEKGFNGVLTYSISKKQITNKAEYNKRRAGVIFPYASIYLNSDKVILNNGGWIHSLKLNQVQNRTKVKPRWHAIEYRLDDVRKFVMMAGDLIFHDDQVLGCGRYFQNNGKVNYKAFKTRI